MIKIVKKILGWVDKTFVRPVEESKMPLGVFILLTFIYAFTRNLLEGAFESLHLLGLSSFTLSGIEEMFLHIPLFYYILFFVIIIGLSWITGHDIRKVTRAVLTYSFLIILPPLIDPILRPGGYRLLYFNNPESIFLILRRLLLLQGELPYGLSPGMQIEVSLGFILVMVYCLMRGVTRKRKWTAFALSIPVMIVAIFFAGGPQGLIGVIAASVTRDPANLTAIYFSGGLINSPVRKYAIALLLPLIPVMWLGLRLYNRQKTRLLVRSLDPFLLILGAVAAGAGFLFAWLGLRNVLTGVPRNPYDYLALVTLLVMGAATAALWIFTANAGDAGKDPQTRLTFRRAAGGMLVLLVLLGWCAGYPALYLLVVALGAGFALGVPPLRLKRFVVPSALLHAAGLFFLVLSGYSVFTTEKTLSVFPWQLSVAVFVPLFAIFLGREWILRRRGAEVKGTEK